MYQKKEQAQKIADDYFRQGFNCAESTFQAAKEVLELGGNTPTSTASGFGGGIGRLGHVCGAISGSVMAAGLCAGRTSPEQKELYNRLQATVSEMVKRFAKVHGSIQCRELIEYDLQDPAQLKRYMIDKKGREKCRQYVTAAVGILVEELEKRRLNGPGG